jgi:cell division septal protein FtsQ
MADSGFREAERAHSGAPPENDRRAGKKRKKTFLTLFVFAAVLSVGLLVLSSPLFAVKAVEISGSAAVSAEEIEKIAGLAVGDNLFSFDAGGAEKALTAHPYIKSVKINKDFPDKVTVLVEERKPRAYVEFKSVGTYLLIDETGRVLESASYAAEELPVIVGLKLKDIALGQPLAAEDTKAFENVVLISHLFDKYELTGRIRVEVSNAKDIHLYIGTLDVLLGGIEDADTKISMVKAILPKIPEGARGFLDVKDIEKNAVFQYLE